MFTNKPIPCNVCSHNVWTVSVTRITLCFRQSPYLQWPGVESRYRADAVSLSI